VDKYIRNGTLAKKSKGALWKVTRGLLLFGLTFILLYPMLFMMSNSFKPVAQNYDPSVIWIPKSFTLQNFADALQVMQFGPSLLNTFSINIVTALIQLCSCTVAGYGFARFRFKGRGAAFAAVLLTIIVPPQVLSLSMYKTFVDLKLIDTVFAFHVPAIFGQGLKSGLYIFVFRQFFRGLPAELDDAATVDGCGTFGIFTRIMIPNATPAILTVFLFSIVWQWSDFYGPAMYMDKYTIATALYNFKINLQELPGMGNNIWDPFYISTRIQAACLLSVAPLLVMYAFLQKRFVEGVERTGIVG